MLHLPRVFLNLLELLGLLALDLFDLLAGVFLLLLQSVRVLSLPQRAVSQTQLMAKHEAATNRRGDCESNILESVRGWVGER